MHRALNLSQMPDLRTDMIASFIHVFDRLCNLPDERRRALKDVLVVPRRADDPSGRDQPLTTTLGQLERMARELFAGTELAPADGSYLDLLFARGANGLFAPTELAQQVRKYLELMVLLNQDMRAAIGREFRRGRPLRTVKVGGSQTVAMRLLANAFSNLIVDRVIPPSPDGLADDPDECRGRFNLRVEIANSVELVRRLNVGLLDFAVAYGRPCAARPVRVPAGWGVAGDDSGADRDICFVPFDAAPLRTVLLCHPECRLWLKDGTDAVRSGRTELALDEIDFFKQRLFVVSSWAQPVAVQNLVGTLRRKNQVDEGMWYDEALAYARMGLGVALTVDIFRRRGRVHTFDLRASRDAPEPLARPVGIYYNGRDGLNPDAALLAEFVRSYFVTYRADFDRGHFPAYGAPDFPGRMGFDLDQDWAAVARRCYPTLANLAPAGPVPS